MDANHLHPLRRWRAEKSKTAQSLADAIGVHKATLVRWELLHRFPGPQHLAAIEASTARAVTAADMLTAWQAGRAASSEPAP